MFDEPWKLALGLLTGMAFGIFLQKGQVAKFQVILGQLLFKDWTVLKIMGTAVAIGTIGVNLLVAAGLATLHIQPASLGRIIFGAMLFGVGMAVLGLCPGTGVAAAGEGRRDAMVGVVGMWFGAAAYVAFFPLLDAFFKSMPDLGKITIAEIVGTSPLIVAVALAVILLLVVRFLPRGPLQPQ